MQDSNPRDYSDCPTDRDQHGRSRGRDTSGFVGDGSQKVQAGRSPAGASSACESDKRVVTDGGGEPVASTGGGRHAPTMGGTTVHDGGYSHFCDVAGSTVYAPKRRCPLNCYDVQEADR